MSRSVSDSESMKMDIKKKLLFVYNADAGFFNTLTDYAHKVLSPKTYPCQLCAITYGNLGMNKDWKRFVSGLPYPVEFLHRDELFKKYHISEGAFPCAYFRDGGTISLLIKKQDIDKCQSVDELKELVKESLQKISE